MNYVVAIFLTFFTVFRPLMPWVDYAVNYRYISEELCINKKVKTFDCNGKCYIAKELVKSSHNDATNSSKTKNTGQKLLDIYVLPDITALHTACLSIASHSGFLYEKVYTFLFLKTIFRPPAF